MENSKKLEKIYLVIGLGKSGYWAAKFLKSEGKRVIILEEKTNEKLKFFKKDLENIGAEVFLNTPFEYKIISKWIENLYCVILSPAIHIDNETVIKLKKEGIKVLGEINIAWSNLLDTKWVGITGTNGKTTVTHLLSHILCQNNLKAPAGGNIGIPICKYAHDVKNKAEIDWIIAELSSYQIEIANEIKPKIGIWTTFTPDHLDRHKTLDNYFNIKNNLLLGSEIRIYNYDDDYLKSHRYSLAKGIWISTESKNNKFCDYWIDSDGYVIESGKLLFNSKVFKLKGNHNIQNLLLATAAARRIGISGNNIMHSLKNYKQLPHRLETIYKSNNIEIINDSKATNFDSSIAGIKSVKDQQILIAGGIIKKGNYALWAKTILEKSKGVFLFGESANKLKGILQKYGFKEDIFIYSELNELIPNALKYLKNSDVKILLFTPSCSSFDQFRNYEERGNFFKNCIYKYLPSQELF